MPHPLPAVPSVAVTVLAISLATGGCTAPASSADVSARSATSSASAPATAPTTAPAPRPGAPLPDPAMATADGDGAAAAGVHALRLYAYAVESADPAPLAAMCSPTSTWCAERLAEFEFRAVTPADRAPVRRSARFDDRSVTAWPTGLGTWVVQVDTELTLVTAQADESTGAEVTETSGPGPQRYDLQVAHSPVGWTLLEATVGPLP